MSIEDKNTQEMKVTVTYVYDAEIFDGEDDMYDVAIEEQKFLKRDIIPYLEGLFPVRDLEIVVTPLLS